MPARRVRRRLRAQLAGRHQRWLACRKVPFVGAHLYVKGREEGAVRFRQFRLAGKDAASPATGTEAIATVERSGDDG